MKKYDYVIGIDPGVQTGVALWDVAEKSLTELSTGGIYDAIRRLELCTKSKKTFLIRVEDARKRTWFGNTGKERLKGAGSVERDCKVLEEVLQTLELDYEMVHPKNNRTKLDPFPFLITTGWKGRTSVHARDAAMLVFGHNGSVTHLNSPKLNDKHKNV